MCISSSRRVLAADLRTSCTAGSRGQRRPSITVMAAPARFGSATTLTALCAVPAMLQRRSRYRAESRQSVSRDRRGAMAVRQRLVARAGLKHHTSRMNRRLAAGRRPSDRAKACAARRVRVSRTIIATTWISRRRAAGRRPSDRAKACAARRVRVSRTIIATTWISRRRAAGRRASVSRHGSARRSELPQHLRKRLGQILGDEAPARPQRPPAHAARPRRRRPRRPAYAARAGPR